MKANIPVPFAGTQEESAVNYATHSWSSYGDETECDDCLSKPWHVAAKYPCGFSIPRIDVPQEGVLDEQYRRFAIHVLGGSTDG